METTTKTEGFTGEEEEPRLGWVEGSWSHVGVGSYGKDQWGRTSRGRRKTFINRVLVRTQKMRGSYITNLSIVILIHRREDNVPTKKRP